MDFAIPSANFTRPADTTAYTAGDLVANSTTAGSVVPLTWTSVTPADSGPTGFRPFRIAGVRLRKTKSDVANAQFRVHLFSTLPTFTSAGDNGAFATVVATGNAGWLCSFDGTMVAKLVDGCSVVCKASLDAPIPMLFGAATVYGLIEALAAYTPASAEVFTADLLVERDYGRMVP